MKKKHGSRFIDLTGQRFGRLIVIKEAGVNKHKNARFLCKCDCGNTHITASGRLRNGETKSCGCLSVEKSTERIIKQSFTHGHTVHGNFSPEYNSWMSMKRRAENRDGNHHSYANVKVCKRWNKFENFLADMGPRPRNTTLSRFSDTGDYKPGNVIWASWEQQTVEQKRKQLLKAA